MKRDLLDLIRADHASVRRLLDLLDEAAFGPSERRVLVAERLREVVAEHVAAEERTVYAALADGAAHGASGALQEHAMIRTLLADLMSMPPEGPQWLSRVVELRRLLERHMRREETTVFPAMSTLALDDLEDLAARFMPASRRQRDGD